ncbi:MAG: phosphoribosylformylglycinamidine synthase I [Candidatus Jordarchaeales archaeon]|nr:phosphoribosylformylglycinamidine synthase I [Candidatus Jordarchaeia archaeon]
MTKVAVLQFPGSNCDLDTLYVLRNIIKLDAELVWHREFKADVYDAVVLPGGFSYGDALRAGVIAAYSPAMKHVKEMAREGKPVLGICNGFQILVEAGILPGALIRNDSLTFICKWVHLRLESNRTVFTWKGRVGQVLAMPIAHNEGKYFNDEKGLKELYENEQIVFKYSNIRGEVTPEANPNGSLDNIAGICNVEGNVLGLMPHPERAAEAILSPQGTEDGRLIFEAMAEFLKGERGCRFSAELK